MSRISKGESVQTGKEQQRNLLFLNTLVTFSISVCSFTPESFMVNMTAQGTVQMILPLVVFFSISRWASWISSIL